MGEPLPPDLPKFDHPPVYETVLGLQFAQLENFSCIHYGLLWEQFRKEYPRHEVHPPLGPVIEQFGTPPPQQTVAASVEFPEIRVWFLNSDGGLLLQVQRDRFLQNWRRTSDNTDYPHYDQLKPKFFEEWNRFCGFLETMRIQKPEVNQCEVTYVNHIDVGQSSYGKLRDIMTVWSGKYSENFLGDPEAIGFNVRYLLPGDRGRLHVALQPAIRRNDAKEILRLAMTARGRPESSDSAAIADWFDLGHRWIVKGFVDITTPRMHERWGRTQ